MAWAEKQGVASAPLLSRSGIDRAVLDDPTGRVPIAAHLSLVTMLSTQLGDPGIGLAIGSSAGPADFGVVSLLAESCATLGNALAQIRRFNALANEASRMDFWIEGRRLLITDGHAPDGRPLPPLLAEATLAYYAAMIRLSLGVREPFDEIWLAHPSHAGWTAERRRHFAATIRFDRPLNALLLPSAMMDAPFVSARPELGAHLSALADRLERALSPTDALASRVADEVRRTLRNGPAPIDRVARALSSSPRSLQRRLALEGTSYAAIVDATRKSEVHTLLTSSHSLEEIAERAGYSDVRALRRACLRWFGATPADRRRNLGA